jgi:hypothetical protein
VPNTLAIQARRIEEKAGKIEACNDIARFDAATYDIAD